VLRPRVAVSDAGILSGNASGLNIFIVTGKEIAAVADGIGIKGKAT